MEYPSDRPKIDRRKVFWYFVLPLAVTGSLLAMYFSGVRLLETLISAPYFEEIGMASRREFGLVENLQNLILLGMIGVALWAVFKHPDRPVKVLMGFVALCTTVLFLEEIDYGLHLYEYFASVPPEERVVRRNLHNVGTRTDLLKAGATGGAIILFGIVPFIPFPASLRNAEKGPGRWIRYLTPDRYMALMLVAMLIARVVGHTLDKRGFGFGLHGNMAEFRELVTYYMGLTYTILLARRRL